MHKLLLGIAASSLMVTGALAHSVPATPAPAPAPTYNSATFDWNGFYAGVGITGLALSSSTTFGIGDIIAGVNVTSGNALFGLEGWIGGWTSSGKPSSGYDVGFEARLGYLVTPEAVLYLSGGGALLTPIGGTGTTYGTIGAGGEFALTDNVSLDLEYKYWVRTGGGVTGNSLGASLNWGF